MKDFLELLGDTFTDRTWADVWKWIAGVCAAVGDYLMPGDVKRTLVVAFLALVFIDLITGIMAAKFRAHDNTHEQLRKAAIKLGGWSAMGLTVSIFFKETYSQLQGAAVAGTLMLALGRQVLSILTNLRDFDIVPAKWIETLMRERVAELDEKAPQGKIR